MKQCKHCGADMSDGCKDCPKCGKSVYLQPESKGLPTSPQDLIAKAKKQPLLYGGVAAAVVLVIVLIVVAVRGNPAKKFFDQYTNGQYVEAMNTYNSNIKGNDKRQQELQTLVEKSIADTVTAHAAKSMDKQTALTALTSLKDAGVTGAEEAIAQVTALQDSRDAYTSAQALEGEGKLEEALAQFALVIEADGDYAAAQTGVTRVTDALAGAVVAQAQALAGELKYDEALAAISEGLTKYAGHAALTAEQQTLTDARAKEIADAIDAATAKADANALEEAIAAITPVAEKYPAETALADKLTQLKDARTAAIAAALADADAKIAVDALDDAVAALKAAAALYPADESLAQKLTATVQAHDAQVARAVEMTDVAIAEDRPYLAAAIAKGALLRHPGEQAILDAQARAGASVDAAVQAIVAGADADVAKQEFAAALSALDAALKRYPDSAPLLDKQAAVTQACEAFAADQIAQAQALVDAAKYDDAAALADAAIAKLPAAPEALTALAAQAAEARAREIEQALADAEARLTAKRYQAAVNGLTPLVAKYPGETALADCLKLAQDKRASDIKLRLYGMNALAESGQFDVALEMAARALSDYPGDDALTKLRVKLMEQRKQDLAAYKADAAALREAGDFVAASEKIGEGIAKYPSETSLLTIRNDIQAAKAEYVAATLQSASDTAGTQGYAAAIALLDAAMPLAGDEQLVTLRDEYAAASEAFAAKLADIEAVQWEKWNGTQYATARATLNRLAAQYPGEAAALAQTEAKFAAMAKAAVDATRVDLEAAMLAGEYKAVREAVSEMLGYFPDDEALSALSAANDKAESDAIDACAQAVQALIDAAKFDEAQAALDQALALYPREARLTDLAAPIKAGENDLQTVGDHIQGLIDAKDYAGAEAALLAAQADFPEAAQLSALAEALRVAREEFGTTSITEIQKMVIALEYDTAIAAVDAALAATGPNEALSSLREQAVAAAEAEKLAWLEDAQAHMDESKYAQAAEILTAALRKYPAETRFTDALSAALTARDKDVADRIAAARQQLDAGDGTAAIAALRQALQLYPGEALIADALDACALAWADAIVAGTETSRGYDEAQAALQPLLDVPSDMAPIEEKIAQLAANREAFVLAELDAAQALADAGEYTQALDRIYADANLVTDSRLVDLGWGIAQRRNEAIKALCSEIEALAENGEYDQAQAKQQEAAALYPNDEAIAALAERIEDARTVGLAAGIDALKQQIASDIAAGDLVKVSEALAQAKIDYPDADFAAQQQQWDAALDAALAASEEGLKSATEADVTYYVASDLDPLNINVFVTSMEATIIVDDVGKTARMCLDFTLYPLDGATTFTGLTILCDAASDQFTIEAAPEDIFDGTADGYLTYGWWGNDKDMKGIVDYVARATEPVKVVFATDAGEITRTLSERDVARIGEVAAHYELMRLRYPFGE